MKRLLTAILIFSAISAGSCKPTFQERLALAVEEKLATYTLDEKIWQLITVETANLKDTIYPVGGIIIFGHDVVDSASLKHLTDSLHALPSEPLLSIDEEGGRVARIGRNTAFNVPRIPAAASVKDTVEAYNCGLEIGRYLKEYGIDIDFAPVADVNTNPENIVIGDRAFSTDPEIAARMVVNCLRGLSDAGIYGCLKHFPGHGDTKADTHEGYAQTRKTWEQIDSCEMIPFKAGIAAGAPLIMSAHIAAPAVTGSGVPSTLSPLMLTEKLRGELGFEGIIITDALRMGAISNEYNCPDATVKAFQAGADIILLPKSPQEAHDALLKAVENGEIAEERVNCSVRRILELKLKNQIN